ncbi:unnamed protein product [Echinostoma caproni]|uniref:Uncharacterized protein n=1 Tax=Echinostoma caproni TaxID=27848 RepID=A0A183AJV1_9TREM|nr:unnamed protein product [Echinostoma caproni]
MNSSAADKLDAKGKRRMNRIERSRFPEFFSLALAVDDDEEEEQHEEEPSVSDSFASDGAGGVKRTLIIRS